MEQRGTIAEAFGLHVARIEHLLQPVRHADRRAARPDRRATRRWAEPLPGADDYLRAEIVYAATHEGARHLDDVLARRTRISIETWDRGVGGAARRPNSWRAGLGWDEEREREVERYRSASPPSACSQEQDDDQEADATRLGVPDIVPTKTP